LAPCALKLDLVGNLPDRYTAARFLCLLIDSMTGLKKNLNGLKKAIE
jgi:hypothetical protein